MDVKNESFILMCIKKSCFRSMFKFAVASTFFVVVVAFFSLPPVGRTKLIQINSHKALAQPPRTSSVPSAFAFPKFNHIACWRTVRRWFETHSTNFSRYSCELSAESMFSTWPSVASPPLLSCIMQLKQWAFRQQWQSERLTNAFRQHCNPVQWSCWEQSGP